MKIATDDGMRFVNVLISGESGTGKTAFASTAPKSLYLAFERQAELVVRKHQRERGVGSCVGILFPESAEDLRAVVRAFHGPRDRTFTVLDRETGQIVFESDDWPITLVIDSVTDAVKLIQDEIDSRVRLEMASDGFADRNMRRRGAYKEECERMFRGVRDVGAHVLWLAILDEGIDEASDGSKKRYAGPLLLAKGHRPTLMQTTNVAGISRRRVHAPERDSETNEITNEARIEYGIQLVGPTYLPLKEYRPLGDFEVPDFSDWLTRIIPG
jgi:hypothetical protein